MNLSLNGSERFQNFGQGEESSSSLQLAGCTSTLTSRDDVGEGIGRVS